MDEHYCSPFWYVVLCLHSESFNSHTAHACFLFDSHTEAVHSRASVFVCASAVCDPAPLRC